MGSNAYADREPVTTRRHDRAWTADLETDEHAADRRLVVAEGIEAVELTSPGRFVDIVTPERHGHPSSYLYPALRSLDADLRLSDEDRCSCGGYVTRAFLGGE
ncbi:hypothetical protein G9464_16415 [Halostella sp. JP-L12]|uniref:CGCGG family putative rSAM-modified RiPP protein n=1 Tax=Halostella TaxID=1843185 RepID=UPI000EF7AD62|nr:MULTISPECIES: hypothetical protein [Halostella]NHN49164.1 hypothetical protein [Halostella sp. JP-L12]